VNGMAERYHDDRETRSADARAAEIAALLPARIASAKANAPGYGDTLVAVDPALVTSREALAALPVLRKSDLGERQKAAPPFGGFATASLSAFRHVFMSPGPIYEPASDDADYWRFGRAMAAAGLKRGQLVHNCFAYHMTPAGMMVETGARACGCPVFPGGVGNTELQVRAIADLRPAFYGGTPSFLKIILEKAHELGEDASSLSRGLVGGEALPPSLRAELADLGCAVLQCYGTADLGLIAYESSALEGMIVDENVIVEIVRPGTGDPVPDGEVGEVVVTTLNPHYPLIRFATGDMSAVLAGTSPCGRTNMRIKGWMGRADQTTKVKGMFVHPSQVATIVKRHPEIGRARLVVTGRTGSDVMTLHCETSSPADDLADAIKRSIQDVTKLRGEVAFAASGTLANDGKVIEDARSYE
jgi:phenylacetate-CoA ligase